jgi:uncharacterized protein YidB (DUF937 family)
VQSIDILSKLGGPQGQQGGIDAISRLFGTKTPQGIISVLQSNGLGNEVKSWSGNGRKIPVSGTDVRDLVDQQLLARMAKQQDMSPDELCEQIAQALPVLVDQATSYDQVPKQGNKDALPKPGNNAMPKEGNKDALPKLGGKETAKGAVRK